MRHLIAFVLLPLVLAQGCASTASSSPSSVSPSDRTADAPRAVDRAKIQELNEVLAGEPATVELTGGEVVHDALSVKFETETVSWQDAAGKERTVPVARVSRVLRDQAHLIGRGFGYGAAAAVLPGYLVAKGTQCKHGCGEDELSGAGSFIAGLLVVVAGGLIGMLVAAANRHPVVVYTGPPALPAAADATSPITLHCRLASGAAGDRFDCSPVAR
jgi:hypothetical protein